MEEEEELSVSQFKAIQKAQTEAYLDFNFALQNVLKNQEDILETLVDLKKSSNEEFRKIEKHYFALEKLFLNFQTLMQSRQEAFENSLEEYTAQISHFGAELENTKVEVTRLFKKDLDEIETEIRSMKKHNFDIKNLLNRAAWVIGGIGAFLTFMNLLTGKSIKEMLGL
jgi:DNA-binding transcriptional regulator YbjK